MNQKYVVFWNSDDHSKLLSWWSSLKKNPGWRAELRRAETPVDVLLCEGFKYLYSGMNGYWTNEKNLLGLATVAGVIAHIETDNGKSFAETCASGDEKPVVSELRFSQIQKSRTIDEIYIRMIRAIHMLNKTVSPISVADNILHWIKEMVNGEIDSDPHSRILVRWGLDYFQHLPKQTTK